MNLVLVDYEFEYIARNGRQVSIKPNERYILVAKTNEIWWHVRKDLQTKPFYIPVKYVRELPSAAQSIIDSTAKSQTSSDLLSGGEPENKPCTTSASTRVQAFTNDSLTMSTFGCRGECNGIKTSDHTQPVLGQLASAKSRDVQHHPKRYSVAAGFSFTSEPSGVSDSQQPYLSPHIVSKDPSEVPQVMSVSKPLLIVELGSSEGHTTQGDPSGQPSEYQDSDIYETISDRKTPELMDLPPPVFPTSLASTGTEVFQQLSEFQNMNPATVPLPKAQSDDDSANDAVYANVAALRQSISESPPCSPYLDPEGWEVHTDQESGQEYYYHPATGRTTWDNPLDPPMDPEAPMEDLVSLSLSQSPGLSSIAASPPVAWASDWEQLVDETSGRLYFYNPASGATSWEPPEQLSPSPPPMEPLGGHTPREDMPPPLPVEDYPAEEYSSSADYAEVQHEPPSPVNFSPDYALNPVARAPLPRANLDRSAPPGWSLLVEPDGTWVFTCEHSQEQWIKSLDDRGKTYYYLKDGSRSQWNLPEAPVASGHSNVGNGVEVNWRHTMCPAQLSRAQEDGKFFFPTHRRNASDLDSEGSSAGNSPETQHHVQNLEKAGILNKTKVSENGKRVRKNWAQCWTVLHGGVLTFHKDPKSAAPVALNKINQIVPEVTVELRGAVIGWAPKDKSSKKNVLELKSRNGVEFLIQYDTESIISDWHKVLGDTIRQLEQQEQHSEEEEGEASEKSSSTDREDRSPGALDKRRMSKSVEVRAHGETDQKKVRTKLIKFLMKRPTLQSVKEKGYFRDNVFGCHLATLCAQERNTVPSFVEKCIRAVERRGLDIDGIYRVSGNLAVIQKLRFKADHEELDLEDGQWEDIHVITGALKLFFRELPEPLFPYSHFNSFIAAIRTADYNLKVSYMCDLVKSLPPANHDTMEILFGHLRKVIEFGEENRMTVQNVAIVFGPTLLRPEMESANITMHMVFQNQIVELILNKYEQIFHSS
ncbi:rho GTPase-activating protein 27-like [Osmerus mordax]|uniref:rho GTPase-activating protein 27-like n=1 Tax=Osmerus mordax TaxID=8014 RepID=UPI00351046DE